MKKHSAAWWVFVSWWWYPYKWLFYSLPRFIIKRVKKARKISTHPLQNPQAITPLTEAQTPKNKPTEAPTGLPETPKVETPKAASQAETPKATGKVETHKVAGISHYPDAVEALGVDNDDYNLSKRELIEEGRTAERIYRTDYFVSRVELVPEPGNPYDPNAIKVICDGQHIGYIKSGSCSRVHRLLREDLIETIEAEVAGGPYKILLEDYEAQNEDGEPVYRIEKDDVPHHAKLRITTK